MQFDLPALIADLGGPATVAKLIGVPRTTPYRWIKSGCVSSRVLTRLKESAPFNVDDYFRV